MVANARIQELIRDNKPEFVPEAIAEGASPDADADEGVDRSRRERRRRPGDRRAAAPNRHDFMIALDRALKEHAVQESAAPAQVPVLKGSWLAA